MLYNAWLNRSSVREEDSLVKDCIVMDGNNEEEEVGVNLVSRFV